MTARWFIVMSIMIAGCTTSITPHHNMDNSTAQLVWPAAPSQARIRYLYSFRSFKDLQLKLSTPQRISDFFSGKKNREMVRPYAIAVDVGMLVVADPGTSAIHIFDTEHGSYQHLSKLGEINLVSPVGIALSKDRIVVADSALEQVFILNRQAKLVSTIDQLSRPTGVAWDSTTRRLFIAETLAHHVQVFDENNKHVMNIGHRGTKDGEFNFPTHLFFKDQMLYVNDTMNFRLQVFNTKGHHTFTFGAHGDAPGQFAQPKGIALDSNHNIYVAESTFNQVQIFREDGVYLMNFGGPGSSPGSFKLPAGLGFFEDKLYVCDSHNGRIQVYEYIKED